MNVLWRMSASNDGSKVLCWSVQALNCSPCGKLCSKLRNLEAALAPSLEVWGHIDSKSGDLRAVLAPAGGTSRAILAPT